jgi:hypothetical protein
VRTFAEQMTTTRVKPPTMEFQGLPGNGRIHASPPLIATRGDISQFSKTLHWA